MLVGNFLSTLLCLFFGGGWVFFACPPVCSAAGIYSQMKPENINIPLPSLRLDHARAIAQAALECSISLGDQTAVVVTDVFGDPIILFNMYRSDEMASGSLPTALEKAKAVVGFRGPSEMMSTSVEAGASMYKVDENMGFSVISGGLPIMMEGHMVGALAIAGSRNNSGCAQFALTNNTGTLSTLQVPTALKMLHDANEFITQAESVASGKNLTQAFSFFDDLGFEILSVGMDKASSLTRDLSKKKALSVLKTGLARSEMLASLTNATAGEAFTGENSNGFLISMAGGLLVHKQGVIMGAIGCAGSGDPTVDSSVCSAAVEAITMSSGPSILLALDAAYAVVEGGLQRAYELSTGVTIAVVDRMGNPRVLYSTDGMPPAGVDQAIRKAQTVAMFPMPASFMRSVVQPGLPYEFLASVDGGVVFYSGAEPLFSKDGQYLLGAVGVYTNGGPSFDNEIASIAATKVGGLVSPSDLTLQQSATSSSSTSIETLHQTCLKAFASSASPIACVARDDKGVIKVLAVEDGAMLGALGMAMATSKTSFDFEVSSDHLQESLRPFGGSGPGLYYSADAASNPHTVATPGGVPLLDTSNIIRGSVGISSSFDGVRLDKIVAVQAASAFKNMPADAMCHSEKSYQAETTALAVLFGLALVGCLVLGYILYSLRHTHSKTANYDPNLREHFLSSAA